MLGINGDSPSVNLDSTLGLPAFWTGCRIIRETIESMPFEVLQKKSDGKYPATLRPEYTLLSVEPCAAMSANSFVGIMAFNVEVYGNAYARIRRDEKSIAISLEPIDNARVEVWSRWTDYTTREVYYKVKPMHGAPSQDMLVLDHDEMIHLSMMSHDGIVGRSVIEVCREALGMMLSAQKYGKEFYDNGAMPSGILSTKMDLTENQSQQIAKDWREKNSGAKNSGKVVVLSNGAEYQHISSTPADAKWVETMQFTGQQIAQMMRIPQHLMGILERSTNNNIEQQSIDFVVHCIRPRIKQWEGEFNRKLWLTPTNRTRYFTKFNLNALLRGDTAARGEFYTKMVNMGAMNRDEVRDLENMNPIPDGNGKEFFIPLNMHPASEPFPNQTPPQDGNKKAA